MQYFNINYWCNYWNIIGHTIQEDLDLLFHWIDWTKPTFVDVIIQRWMILEIILVALLGSQVGSVGSAVQLQSSNITDWTVSQKTLNMSIGRGKWDNKNINCCWLDPLMSFVH